MFKQFINNVQGADVYMITSLLIFSVFFVLVGIYLFMIDKKHAKDMSYLPLKD
ncbi:hypothetical protein SAMN04515674_102143 [Pseudarcicella hirudinis]|uniref:Cbb3-type cytochrome oxidase component FixQ n=1 Tax=Pseudarcicella hirudinis TaxID=1079859 RepID=A0A1I5NVS8_9BACT|nr:hypothetical protein [Pseudarcicella hirudinis]SFP25918.1 hypothetical protein SAMN04515674_102143 [Pseudarcicella hirudinis]